MSWWSIIKISDDAKRNIMDRFGSKKDIKKPKSVGQSFGTKGKTLHRHTKIVRCAVKELLCEQ